MAVGIMWNICETVSDLEQWFKSNAALRHFLSRAQAALVEQIRTIHAILVGCIMRNSPVKSISIWTSRS